MLNFMRRNYFITGLDIGTDSVKGLVARKKPNSPDLEAISQSKVPSFGIRRGAVVDIESASKSIAEVIEQLRDQIHQKIDGAYVNIGGSHIFVATSRGSVAVSRADQRISQEDIDRVLQAAQAISLPPNKEILDVFPKEFIVDGERGLKEVLGLRGIRLEVEILALCAFSLYFKNLTNAVLNSGIQILDVIPSPIAAARAILTPQQKELGAAVVDIGAGTTGLAVYEEGDLIYTTLLPMGSAHITNDIAIGLRTETEIAEKIKRKLGSCASKITKKIEKIELPHQNFPLIFSQKTLTKIIEARVSEIFGEINKELKRISRQGLLPAGIILTGGGSKLPGMVEFAKRELKLPARIGIPQGFIGLEEDPALSTVCGLVLKGIDLEEGVKRSWGEGGWGFSSPKEGIGSKIKKFFRIFIP